MDENTTLNRPLDEFTETLVPPADTGTLYSSSPTRIRLCDNPKCNQVHHHDGECGTGTWPDPPLVPRYATIGNPVPPIPENSAGRKLRITELMRQRDILDREIAWLAMNLGDDGRPWWDCKRCGHRWQSYRPAAPRTCSNCHSPAWQTERRTPGRPRSESAKKLRREELAAERIRLGKRPVGRPTNAARAEELRMLREKYERDHGPTPLPMPTINAGPTRTNTEAPVIPARHYTDSVDLPASMITDHPYGLPSLPPPPRSLSDELEFRRGPYSVRHVPDPRLPDDAPGPLAPLDPDPEPIEPDENAEPPEEPPHE